MYTLYSALAGLALVLSAPFWLLRMLTQGKYRAGLAERFGRIPDRLRDPQRRPTIWVHAVSVGEVLAVSGLISELQQRATSLRIVISTTTAAGQKLARDRYGGGNVFYFPLDFAFAVRPYLRALRPQLIVVAETEFWPNFLRLARQSGVRVAVVNARVSDRSFPRYRRVRGLVAAVLSQVNLFLAQGEEDRRRLLEIGAPSERVHVSGNLKFDLQPAAEAPLLTGLRTALQRDRVTPVFVCGSTVEGEEPIVLQAFTSIRERFPNALMILAPRHPERFTPVADMLAASGTTFVRRSQWDGSQPIAPGIFLLDSIGELASSYALADIAFVGGSLVPKGGHNILEAAQHGVATIVGPYTENFRDMVALFRQAGALVVATAGELPQTLLSLLTDETRRRGLGARAREILRDNAGATTRTIVALEMLLGAQTSAAADRIGARIAPPVED
jgi:3-deoxy-D-manno-octulosonic-acid transferase